VVPRLQAIVRYASTSYTESTSATARTSFLTNTFVGKQQTGGGVGPITGSLAELGEHLAPQVCCSPCIAALVHSCTPASRD
jgi:hypothetical protein